MSAHAASAIDSAATRLPGFPGWPSSLRTASFAALSTSDFRIQSLSSNASRQNRFNASRASMYSFVRVSSTTSRSLSKERQRRSGFDCHVSSSCSDWLRCGGRSASRAGSRRAARSTTCSTNDPGSQADDGAVEGQRHPSPQGRVWRRGSRRVNGTYRVPPSG